MVRTKSVFSAIDKRRDGPRVLATRFRGRGMRKTRYDVWMPNLGPSERLLGAIQSETIAWATFSRRYRAELFENSPLDKGNSTIKNHGQKFTLRLLNALAKRGNVTLMCHCHENASHCHRFILERVLSRRTLAAK
jgi:uncharacterized protein YeaO (DUF488 family)